MAEGPRDFERAIEEWQKLLNTVEVPRDWRDLGVLVEVTPTVYNHFVKLKGWPSFMQVSPRPRHWRDELEDYLRRIS
jgi:hypothetical protein